MNLYPVTVVDNFYDNPDAIRKFALAQKYQFCHDRPDIKHVYPGSRTKGVFDLDVELHEKICKKLVSKKSMKKIWHDFGHVFFFC